MGSNYILSYEKNQILETKYVFSRALLLEYNLA